MGSCSSTAPQTGHPLTGHLPRRRGCWRAHSYHDRGKGMQALRCRGREQAGSGGKRGGGEGAS
eukprot:5802221-Alexandrium_andersonii.AAC.1